MPLSRPTSQLGLDAPRASCGTSPPRGRLGHSGNDRARAHGEWRDISGAEGASHRRQRRLFLVVAGPYLTKRMASRYSGCPGWGSAMTNPPESPVEFELVLPEPDEEAPFPIRPTARLEQGASPRDGFWAGGSRRWMNGRKQRRKGPSLPFRDFTTQSGGITWLPFRRRAGTRPSRWFRSSAAAVPVLVATSGESFAFKSLIAALGGLVVILEGVQQLKQYSWNA